MEGQGVSRAMKQALLELKQEVAQAAAAASKVGGPGGRARGQWLTGVL